MASRFVQLMKDTGIFIYNAPGFFAAGFSRIFLGNSHLEIRSIQNASGQTIERTYQWNLEKQDWEKKGPTSFLDKLRVAGVLGSLAIFARETVAFCADTFVFLAKGISAFVSNHSTAITIGFWAALLAAGLATGIAAAVFYISVPAFEAFVGYSVFGVSIHSLAGAAGFAAELGIVAGLGAGLATLGTVVIASIVNTIEWIKSCCRSKVEPDNEPKPEPAVEKTGDAPGPVVESKPVAESKVVVEEPKSPYQPPKGGDLFEAPVQPNVEHSNDEKIVEKEPVPEISLTVQPQ